MGTWHRSKGSCNLLELTKKHRIFTTDGQSSYHDDGTEERSYLACYMEETTFKKVKTKLLHASRTDVVFITPQYEEITALGTFHKKIELSYDLGDLYTAFNRSVDVRDEYSSKYQNVISIIKELYFCFILCNKC